MIVKAISVRQPWAWAIVHGGKDVENRIWRPNYRGPLLIHASSNMTRLDYEVGATFCRREAGLLVPEPGELERGGIVGAARAVDVVLPGPRHNCWHFPEQFGLVLADKVGLRFRPLKGRLFFFPVELRRSEVRILARAGIID